MKQGYSRNITLHLKSGGIELTAFILGVEFTLHYSNAKNLNLLESIPKFLGEFMFATRWCNGTVSHHLDSHFSYYTQGRLGETIKGYDTFNLPELTFAILMINQVIINFRKNKKFQLLLIRAF